MRAAAVKTKLVAWLKKQVRDAGAKGIVVGLSGGIDSAVVAACAKLACGKNCLGVIMPCHSLPDDEKTARLVARHLGLPVRKADLSRVYDAFIKAVPKTGLAMVRANIKPRLRMATLYYFAGLNGYLVAGTGNKTELELGYFTKYGDGGVDMLPLAGLVKSEVRALARELKLPAAVIARKPSAGLWAGQTDEDEIGLPYDVLDCLVRGQKPPCAVPAAKLAKIKRMMKGSEHKRKPVPAFTT